ncbi:hypothetical protein PG997_014143 [Apiospora hydei]|uniref:Uncharacterized protein n=1 Tax=Apiospora hydei TaxID=1337664 RepID=A0ABR1V882_9PEZI
MLELALRIFGTLFAFVTFLLLGYWMIKASPQEVSHDCGVSPEEASAKGCVFDMLAFAWVPQQCFDAELSSTYNTYEDFEFFYERENNNSRIPVDELKKGVNRRVYTSGKYHRTHCTYAWQTLQRAVLHGYALSDNKTMNQGHFDHCSYYLINIDHSYRARFTMDYLHCEKLSSGKASSLW